MGMKGINMDISRCIQLTDPNIFPDIAHIQNALGNSYQAYDELMRIYNKNSLINEWKYYKDGKAWLCKIQKTTKTIAWMSIWNGFIMVTIYFTEKNVDGVYNLGINEETKESIRNSKRIGKMIPCTFEIDSSELLKDVEEVMIYKMNVK